MKDCRTCSIIRDCESVSLECARNNYAYYKPYPMKDKLLWLVCFVIIAVFGGMLG